MVHLLVGIQGSGKTTFSKILQKDLGCDIVSSDAIRNLHPAWSEDLIWPELYRLISQAIVDGHDVIFDATNITPKVRKRFKDNVEALGVKMQSIAYFFDTPLDVCIQRVEERNKMPNERYLPIEVISSYHQALVKPSISEGYSLIKIIKDGKIVEIIE